MDFLDPKKRQWHNIKLVIGYFLVGILILLGTTVLLFQAYGFGLDKKGHIFQNGLVFVSSTPSPSQIYINGQLKANTNTRLTLPSGQYTMQLKRTGYYDWQRAFNVEASSVEHFDYPFLFPKQLVTSGVQNYTANPGLSTQTPDRRYLLVGSPTQFASFLEYDLNSNPIRTAVNISLAANIFSSPNQANSAISFLQWSSDNRHAIIKHLLPNGGVEFILFDRTTPANSLNLTQLLGGNFSDIKFIDNVYSSFYLFDSSTQALSTASLTQPAPVKLLSGVLAYKSYGTKIVLYASSTSSVKDQVDIKLLDGTQSFKLTSLPTSSSYSLALAQYNGDWFMVAGASSDNKVYIYKNPESQLSDPRSVAVPIEILRLDAPSHVEFSANTQYIMAEGQNQLSVYDGLNDKGYTYDLPGTLDAPQTSVRWMDGNRIDYVSKGKTIVFDYDSTNLHTLGNASPDFITYFDQSYKYLYQIESVNAVQLNGGPAPTVNALSRTALRIPSDL